MSIQRSGLNDCKRRPKRKRRLAPCWRTVVRGFQRTRIGLEKRWWIWFNVLTKNQQHTSTSNQHTSAEYCMVQPNTSSHMTYPCQGVWFNIHVAHRCGWVVNLKQLTAGIHNIAYNYILSGFIDAIVGLLSSTWYCLEFTLHHFPIVINMESFRPSPSSLC